MKKTNVAKVILVILIGMMLLTIRTGVYAADSDNSAYQDLANALNSADDDSDDDSDDESDDEENNTSNETRNNSTGNNTLNTSSLRNTSNITRANTSATSNVYNNSNLPKTGISDSVPVVVLIVIFGISAVYAYKKVNDYRSL